MAAVSKAKPIGAPDYFRTGPSRGATNCASCSQDRRRTAMKPWPLLAVMAALALQGPSWAATQAKPPSPEEVAESAGAPLIGKYAPALKLRTLDGKTIDLAKLY